MEGHHNVTNLDAWRNKCRPNLEYVSLEKELNQLSESERFKRAVAIESAARRANEEFKRTGVDTPAMEIAYDEQSIMVNLLRLHYPGVYDDVLSYFEGPKPGEEAS